MKKQEFDNEEFKRKLGVPQRALQPYNFERYRKINRNLTEEVYKQLRINGSEWKILCGLSVSTHWGNEILKEVWELKCDEYYKQSDYYIFRYTPEKYLKLEW